MVYKIDFFLDELLSSRKPLNDLNKYTETNKKYFNLPEDIDLIWIKTPGHNLTPERISETIDKVRTAITSPKQIIVFWSAETNNLLDDNLVKHLNEFSESVSNPIIFVTGMLGRWAADWIGKIKFTLSPLMYFDYEALNTWEKDIEFPTTRSKKFLSMGTKDHANRKYLLSNIITNNLLDQGYVSYMQFGGGPLSGKFSLEEKEHITQVADLADSHLPLPAIDSVPNDWTRMPREFLTNSYLNMVTDTFYDTEVGTNFFSEKVFNAMIHQQLFMYMGPPGSLAYLRMQGYRTFSGLIDESYDLIDNHHDRLIALTKTFIEFVSRPIDEIHKIYTECVPILEHNRACVYQSPLPAILLTELKRAVYEKTQIK